MILIFVKEELSQLIAFVLYENQNHPLFAAKQRHPLRTHGFREGAYPGQYRGAKRLWRQRHTHLEVRTLRGTSTLLWEAWKPMVFAVVVIEEFYLAYAN